MSMSCPELAIAYAGAISVLEGIALVSLLMLHHAGHLVLFSLLQFKHLNNVFPWHAGWQPQFCHRKHTVPWMF